VASGTADGGQLLKLRETEKQTVVLTRIDTVLQTNDLVIVVIQLTG
jgi:ribosomal protein L18E